MEDVRRAEIGLACCFQEWGGLPVEGPVPCRESIPGGLLPCGELPGEVIGRVPAAGGMAGGGLPNGGLPNGGLPNGGLTNGGLTNGGLPSNPGLLFDGGGGLDCEGEPGGGLP